MGWRLNTTFAVACAGLAVAWYWVADPGLHESTDPTDGDFVADEREAADARRRELQARARNLSDRDAEAFVRPSAMTGDYGSGEIDRAAATASFEEIMATVETFAASRERIHREEWDALYRSANDSFAVLSNHLDANDPGDRETLETAHRRLQEGLRRVRVRGKKFSDI